MWAYQVMIYPVYEQYAQSHVLMFLVSIYNVLVSSSDIKAAILVHMPANCIIPKTVCVFR